MSESEAPALNSQITSLFLLLFTLHRSILSFVRTQEKQKEITAMMNEQRIARMLSELANDLNLMVESGDLTADEANTWMNDKAEQWHAENRAQQ